MWDKIELFHSKEEQQKCKLKHSNELNLRKFKKLNEYGEYSVEFISCVLELLMIQEKTGLATAFMFKKVLDAIYEDKDIFSIVSAAGYKGR